MLCCRLLPLANSSSTRTHASSTTQPQLHSQESPALKPLVGEWLAQIPAGRLAEVSDLQAAVVFLASEASNYMTGHNLVLEGGQSLW